MSKKLPVFLFSFANDPNAWLQLGEEQNVINQALADLVEKAKIEYQATPFTSLKSMYNTLDRFNNRIYFFHYGGHSDGNGLMLSDTKIRKESLAVILGRQKKLKLVFLNGCANINQVKTLWDKGVKAVIATSGNIGDKSALHFAERFYKAIASRQTINEAFDTAKSYLTDTNKNISIEYIPRGIGIIDWNHESVPWGLYIQDESILGWSIDDIGKEETLSTDNLRKIRESFKEIYEKRINSKLAYRFPINIELEYSTEGSDKKVPIYDNLTIPDPEIKEELLALFYKHRGRLLVVGAPGSGKTTMILQLALKILEKREKRIPIIIDIVTWRNRFKTVDEWLTELLPQMGFSKGLAKQILKEDRLLPFFDGLDELRENERSKCLNAIAKYGVDQNKSFIISSRIEEYSGTVDAPVYCQIKLKALSLGQIKIGIKSQRSSPEKNGILNAIEEDPLLAESIQTPFYLNSVQLLFSSSKSWREFGFKAKNLNDKKQEITEEFINQSLTNFSNQNFHQAKKSLGFIAHCMNNNGLISLELTDFSYRWGKWSWAQLFIGRIIFCLVNALSYIFIYTASISFFFMILVPILNIIFQSEEYSVVENITKGIVEGLVFGIFVGFIYSIWICFRKIPLLNFNEISTSEKIKPSIKFFLKFFKENFLDYSSIKWGFFSGAAVGLMLFLIMFNSQADLNFLDILGYLLLVPGVGIIGIIMASVYGFFLTLFFSFTSAVTFMLENTQAYLKIRNPYQRFYNSMWIFHFSILRHYHLRYLFYKKELLPFQLVSFLNEATSNHILEFESGSWRFRHRILQDYFAEHWIE